MHMPFEFSILAGSIYFTLKHFLFSKIFSKKQVIIHPLISVAFAVLGILLTHQLQIEYTRYLEMSTVKGAIQLPSYVLLFFLADFVTSLILIGFFSLRLGVVFFKKPYARVLMDVARLFVIFIVFTTLVSSLWSKQIEKETNWQFNCFKYQIAIDLSAYYFQHGKLPEKLEQFTSTTKNPVNDSLLLYFPDSILKTKILDEKENVILAGYVDLMGLEQYKNEPQKFYTKYDVVNEVLCKNSLRIPKE